MRDIAIKRKNLPLSIKTCISILHHWATEERNRLNKCNAGVRVGTAWKYTMLVFELIGTKKWHQYSAMAWASWFLRRHLRRVDIQAGPVLPSSCLGGVIGCLTKQRGRKWTLVSRSNRLHLDSIIHPGCFWLVINDSVTPLTPLLKKYNYFKKRRWRKVIFGPRMRRVLPLFTCSQDNYEIMGKMY